MTDMQWAGSGREHGVGVSTAALGDLTADLDLLVAAAAVVLSRYTGDATVSVAIRDDAGWQAVNVPVDDAAAAVDHVATTVLSPRRPLPPDDRPVIACQGAQHVIGEQRFPILLVSMPGQVVCRYRRDLVDRPAADWLVHCVRAVLGQLTAPGAGPVGSIDLLAGAPPGPTPLGPSDPAAARPARTVPELVREQADSRPDAVALVGGGRRLSYRELERAACAVARLLHERGVTRGNRVGVCLDRSPLLVVGLLGVMKTGAAYVPLAPALPAARLAYLVRDADLATILAEPDTRATVDGLDDGVRTLTLTEEVFDAADPVPDQPWTCATDDPAYLIYTSGSTGEPKGVVVEQHNVAALLDAATEFGFGPGDVWTAFHSYAFDYSVWEMWTCLTTGGRLVIVPVDVLRDPVELHRLLRAEHVTVLNLTPSEFAPLLRVDGGEEPLADLRMLFFGGEQLDTGMLVRWFDRYPENSCRVVNMYGITETTVVCTWGPVTRGRALSGSLSIGAAIPGWSVEVVDGQGRRVPPGVAGELVIRGAGVTPGYHRRPELTARRFVADRRSSRAGARQYRSGDRGRMLPDGEIDYLGRLDEQVKIRGHRVELGEIRAQLLTDPAVLAAAVVLNRRGDGEARLDAYVVGAVTDRLALRERLGERLPAYMVPSSITVVGELPLTHNGKLDVARLPPVRPFTTTAGAAEGTALEHEVGRVWSDVLGLVVAPDDNLFLVAGGSSLSAAKIAAQLREAGLGEISVRDIYENPTVRATATRLAADRP
ncbi:non-ribosomal peptide synthetase [Actinophytocola oryzae]|uniref:Amino acid adenylation domain-containing protein n=1 Tax=Actinophytocola oryzae TaxID=502181 RepID=A0A4R7URX2_9PSEU|nr:non-ribosomal peptide synthetase [Actinophytocola oryzae]TDV37798.1 amino acid adenylation domain-containing protein [Actinophytocola oryzae]